MRITKSELKSFLEKPAVFRGVLIYGNDSNKIDFYSKKIVASLREYQVHEMDFSLANKTPGHLFLELSNISMFNSKKLIKLINVENNISQELRKVLENNIGEHYVIMLSHELTSQSKTKYYIENSKIFGLIPCYKDNNENLCDVISSYLRESNVHFTSEAMNYLQSYFNNNRASIYSELEKLILYLGEKKNIELSDIDAFLYGDTNWSYKTLDDLCCAVAVKDVINFIKVSDVLILYENFSPIALIRILSNYFLLLLNVMLSMQDGVSRDAAINQLNPPIFFRQLQNFKNHLDKLKTSEVQVILSNLINLEVACKSNDLDSKLIFQQVMLIALGKNY
ncbi:DNA polymerase III subunit delta [Wolbachia endosymbiont of Pentidionis agamae]|uniref:DNA polymerase III subunit delta n=1 Tax=Wolbachia endosymbiont of Pentidionis agamae TaxID=3110435 RepID=UPI002FD6B6C7